MPVTIRRFGRRVAADVCHFSVRGSTMLPEPHDREITRLYLEVADLLDAYKGRHYRVADVGEETTFLAISTTSRYGVTRARLSSNFEFPQIDQPGYASGDHFVLIPGTNFARQTHHGTTIDQNGNPMAGPEDNTKLPLSRRMAAARSGLRAGTVFAEKAELRSLIEEIRASRYRECGDGDA